MANLLQAIHRVIKNLSFRSESITLVEIGQIQLARHWKIM